MNDSEFFVTKDAKGEQRWVLVSSSAYVDRDGEIVTEKALVKAVERMEQSGEYGDLRWWHTPVVLGRGDFAAIHAHHLVESGTFVNKAVAARVMAAADRLGASIGFRHPATEPSAGQYSDITIKERSLLPRGRESNLFTVLAVTGGKMDESKKAQLIELVGETEAAGLLARLDTTAKQADEAGVTRKDKGLFARFMDWASGQEEFKEADEDTPAKVELTVTDSDGDETTLTAEIDGEGDEAETKATKENDDPDGMPVTRAELKAAIAAIRKEIAGSSKETDVSGLATKIEVAAVLGEANAAKEAATAAQKAADALAGDLPRGVAAMYRATKDGATVTEKAGTLAEKAAQSNDPMDAWVNSKFGA